MNEEVITIRLSKLDVYRIKWAVTNGHFTNRSDFIRTAVRNLADQVIGIPESIKEARKKAKEIGVTDKDIIRWSKEARKYAHRRKKRR